MNGIDKKIVKYCYKPFPTVEPHKDRSILFKAKIFKALSDPYRLQIVQLLRDGEKCVCETVPHVGIIQPVVSRHLKILKDFGIVKDRKERNRRFYSIVDRKILNVIDAITPELLESLSKRMIQQTIPEEHP